jgi:hypothetical protein
MIKTYILFLVLFLPIITFSQSKDSSNTKTFKNLWIQASYQNGYVFPTNTFVRGINAEHDTINNFQTFALIFTKQSKGDKLWQQLYAYPQFGFGVYVADFYNPEEIGNPIAFFGYFKAPFHRWNSINLYYELGLGVAFNWKHYSPANPYNIAIGAKGTVYIDLGFGAEYRISESLQANLGFSLSHFSNGKIKQPNFGFNTIAPKLTIKYRFSKDNVTFQHQKVPKFQPNNEFYLSVFTGAKNILYDSLNTSIIQKYEGESYYIYGISAVFNRHLTYKSKVGFGFEFSYNGALDAQIAVNNGLLVPLKTPFENHLQLSIFPSYELVVDKFSVLFQPSFYVFRKKVKNPTPIFYQRIGIKYNLYKNLYIGVNLRAYKFYISDFIEWNIGYAIK